MSANQIIEGSQSDNSADRFIYFAEIPTLREISSNQVALAIRYSDDSRRFFDPNDFFYLNDKKTEKYDSQVESLPTPTAIQNIIKISVEKIEQELHLWLQHFNHVLYGLSRRLYKVFEVDINWCVWLPNGEIDYLKTGMKMLKSEELNEIQKFLILCEYCMEDEIKKVSLDTLPADYIESTDYYDDGILVYWIHFLKNTLQEVPLENYASPEAAMARNFRRYARFANEYFWHRVCEDDQFSVVSEWISSQCNSHFDCVALERLISAMPWNQQRRLLAQKCGEVTINLSLNSRSTRCALWAWKFCKEEMPKEEFARIVEMMLRRWAYERQLCPALIEIWETAYDHQRNFVIQTMAKKIIEICIFMYINNAPGNVSAFMIRFLRQAPLQDRKEMLSKLTTKVKITYFDLFTFNEILDGCLSSSGDKSTFIKSIIESSIMKIHFLDYMYGREFTRLNAVLEYYFGEDIEEARKFKIRLLEDMKFVANSSIAFICNVDEWKKLGKFIDEIFSNDPLQAFNEKQRLIKLAIKSEVYRGHLFNHRRGFQETARIVEMEFTGEELKSIKGVFASSFGESLKSRSYWVKEDGSDETYFFRIIDWCLGDDEEAILEFKKHVSKDAIFGGIYLIVIELYKYREAGANIDNLKSLLERLNKYLEWYFASHEEMKSFKLSRVSSSFEMVKVFGSNLNKDGEFLEMLLKWFFDGDDEQMQKFRSENLQ